jgi:hypothetical protein
MSRHSFNILHKMEDNKDYFVVLIVYNQTTITIHRQCHSTLHNLSTQHTAIVYACLCLYSLGKSLSMLVQFREVPVCACTVQGSSFLCLYNSGRSLSVLVQFREVPVCACTVQGGPCLCLYSSGKSLSVLVQFREVPVCACTVQGSPCLCSM